ncbi:MAG: hypothetical protein ACKO6Q_02215 [Bacteroidota bacterium]
MLRKILLVTISILIFPLLLFFLYFNNVKLASPITANYYRSLQETLRSRGYSPNLLVICTKRHVWVNKLLVRLNGAASDSRHLNGEAIDFVVFDVNGDGRSNSNDVDIVYRILDREIIADKGGIGTYKQKRGFFNKQMIHIDCRGSGKRWDH